MIKQNIIHQLTEKYLLFTAFINDLNAESLQFSYQGKWSAAEQLENMILCTKPIVKVFGMDKETIRAQFGETNRKGRSIRELLADYQEKLNAGGKAPEKFLPTEGVQSADRTHLLVELINELCARIEKFSETELDTLLIPHPLLGNLTLREMLFNAISHVEHHHALALQYLKQLNS